MWWSFLVVVVTSLVEFLVFVFGVSSQSSPACQLHRQPLEVLILTSVHVGEQSAEECVQQLTQNSTIWVLSCLL